MTLDNTIPEEFKSHLTPGKDWKEIVAWIGDLPPLPHVASRALVLVEDPDTTAGQLTELLGSDTGLAARVLKIANSAMFSMQREITTLSQAIMVIGFKALKGIIVAATLRQLNRRFGSLEKMVWENSTCTATTAFLIAQQLRQPYAEEVFLLGLLHDLGKLVLLRQVPDDYRGVFELTRGGLTFFQAEQEKLGFSHPLIGALVAKKWNFSPDTCQIILHHHDPVPGPSFDNAVDEKTVLVQAADSIAHCLGHGHTEGYPDQTDNMKTTLSRLGFDAGRAENLVESARQTFEKQGAAFN